MVVKTMRDGVNEVTREKIEEFTHWQELHKVGGDFFVLHNIYYLIITQTGECADLHF